jgi:hypothetical protein
MTISGITALNDADVDAVLGGQRPSGPPPQVPATAGAGAQAPVFYPGTVRAGDAAGLLLGPGEDRQNMDIPWQPSTSTRLSGVVSTADGSPLPPVSVMITTAAGSTPLSMAASVRVGADGQFVAPQGLPPATYRVTARGNDPRSPFAVATVEAAGTDISGLQLVLQPPLEIAGRIVATGAARPPSLAGQRLQFSALVQRGVAPQVTPAAATGEFTITGLLPGEYMFSGAPFFGASADSVTWGLGSISIDGRDATDRTIDIRSDALPKELVVTFTDQWQEVAGRLTNAQGAGVSDYTMLIFPTDESLWLYNSRRHATAQPGTDGSYRLGGPGPAMLPAGEYYLAAVTDVSKDEQYDPAFLKSLVPASLKITLRPGQKVTQNVRVQ